MTASLTADREEVAANLQQSSQQLAALQQAHADAQVRRSQLSCSAALLISSCAFLLIRLYDASSFCMPLLFTLGLPLAVRPTHTSSNHLCRLVLWLQQSSKPQGSSSCKQPRPACRRMKPTACPAGQNVAWPLCSISQARCAAN